MTPTVLTFHLLSPAEQAAFRAAHPPKARVANEQNLKRMWRPRVPSCADLDDELLTAEIAAKGLDTRRRWVACKTGEHIAHSACGRAPKATRAASG